MSQPSLAYPFRAFLEFPPDVWPWVRPFLASVVRSHQGKILASVTQESFDGTVPPCLVTIAFQQESDCTALRMLCRKMKGHKIVFHQRRLTPWTRLQEQNYRRSSTLD